MGQLLRHDLDGLAPLGDLPIYSLVLCVEGVEISGELFCHVRSLTKHLTSESLNLLNSPGASGLFLDRQVVAKFILILLSQKVNEKLAPAKDLRLHDACHEFLVVNLFLLKLLPRKLLLLIDKRKRRDNHLRILSDEVVTQLDKVDVEPLHFPTHWI